MGKVLTAWELTFIFLISRELPRKILILKCEDCKVLQIKDFGLPTTGLGQQAALNAAVAGLLLVSLVKRA